MHKLTKKIIESVVPSDRDQYLWDQTVPGFGVRIFPSGKRSYVVQYRLKDRRQRKRSLGQHGVITLEQARASARNWLAEVSQGSDPAFERDMREHALTIADLAERYMTEHAAVKKKAHSIRFATLADMTHMVHLHPLRAPADRTAIPKSRLRPPGSPSRNRIHLCLRRVVPSCTSKPDLAKWRSSPPTCAALKVVNRPAP